MAVFTPVTRAELEAFLGAYDLGRLRAFEGIRSGWENSNFRVETARGRFVLTLFEKRVRAADLPFFAGLMAHLAARGLPCPVPVAGRDGAVARTLNGRPALLVTFLEGPPPPEPPTVAQCRAVGGLLAGLHRAAADFPLHRPNAMGPEAWPALAPAEAPEVQAELRWLGAQWPAGLPRGIVHGDLFPDNTLFDGDRVCGVFDFYFAAEEALVFDLGICLNAWCFDAPQDFRRGRAAALLAGYQAVRPLSAAEKTALPAAARGTALRFYLTRLQDWQAPAGDALVDRKDPLEYWGRLRCHQRADGPAFYGVE